MSRIGRLPITVPAGVDVTFDGRVITVKGPRGVLTRELPPRIEVTREGETLVVTRPTENKLDKSLHGLTRTLVNNMVIGVTTSRSPSRLTSMRGGSSRVRTPRGPLTVMTRPSSVTSTPAGMVMGRRPMRDIALPDVGEDLATELGLAGLRSGHDPL